jgi:hypothetical protein
VIHRAQGAKVRGYTWNGPSRSALPENLTLTSVITPSVKVISPI